MPLKPRLYAIPRMTPETKRVVPVMLPHEPCYGAPCEDGWQCEAHDGDADSKPTMSDSYDRYLDGIAPEHYCARHDMYRPCHWCDEEMTTIVL